MIPPEVTSQILQAGEIMIGAHGPLPEELWTVLRARQPRNGVADVLIPGTFDAGYVRKMLDLRLGVYQAVLPPGDSIFLDRKHGYRLPEWTPLRDPFAAACQLTWTRTAYYTCIHDTVASILESRLLKVEERSYLWFNVRDIQPLPGVGEHIVILANRPFIDAETPLLDAVAIWIEEKGLNGGSKSS